MLFPRWTIIGFAACWAVTSVARADIDLRFGVYAADKPTRVVKQFRPILTLLENSLSRELGEPVSIRMRVTKDHLDSMHLLSSGSVDFARLDPVAYVRLKTRQAGIRIIALEQSERQAEGGVFCVRETSLIFDINDLKGRSFAFANSASALGRYLAQQFLVQNNMRAEDFSFFQYLARYDSVAMAVAAGSYDAGIVEDVVFKRMLQAGEPVRAIKHIPGVAYPWLARSRLDAQLLKIIKEVLLNIKNDSPVLSSLGKDGFVRGEDADFNQVREAMNVNQQFFH